MTGLLMQPPDLRPSSTGFQDAATLSALSSTISPAAVMTSSSSLLFDIATATASSTVIAVLSSTPFASPAMASAGAGSPDDGENNGECKLLGPFAILVQGGLGALALLSLVYKRWRERPQRPIKIWAFDVSKQVFGSVLLHLANLLLSLFSAGQIQLAMVAAAAPTAVTETYQPNPCSFYLLNLGIDTTIGIPILIVILKVLTVGASYTPIAQPPESIVTGNYGDPPRVTWWLKQSIIYFLGLLGMKACVFFIFQLLPWIVQVGDWALRWTEGNEAVQIAFVMLIFPLIMNALQYYIIDAFIKTQIPEDDQQSHHGTDSEHGGLLAGEHADHRESIDQDEVCKAANPDGIPEFGGRETAAYDPDKDDTFSGAVGESSSLADSGADEAVEQRHR